MQIGLISDTHGDLEAVKKSLDLFAECDFNWEGQSFLINHGDKRSQEDLLALAQEERCHFVITGHTHVFGYQLKNGIYLINPGSPSLPKGQKIKTIAVISDETFRFINIEDGAEVLRAEIQM
jgi:predicted phosphodiesterase